MELPVQPGRPAHLANLPQDAPREALGGAVGEDEGLKDRAPSRVSMDGEGKTYPFLGRVLSVFADRWGPSQGVLVAKLCL